MGGRQKLKWDSWSLSPVVLKKESAKVECICNKQLTYSIGLNANQPTYLDC